MNDLPDAIMAAHAAIRPHVPVSPLERSGALSGALGCDAAEHWIVRCSRAITLHGGKPARR